MISDETRRRFAELSALLETRPQRGRWLVLTHDNPDPDALAAAAILARVLRHRFRHPTTTAYGGIIGRAENQQMVKTLGLRMSHVRHLNWKNYKHVALVDTQPRTGNNQLPEDRVPDIVLDHHPTRRASHGVPFADIRTSYGATATLATEYLLAADLEPTRELATALVYAIRAETQNFAREFSGPDKTLYEAMLPRADIRALARIQTPPLPWTYYQSLHRAIESVRAVSTLVVSHLGSVAQPDIVPEVADLLLRLEGKTWSLATGVYDGRLYLSMRTTNPRADAGRMMRRLLGRRGKGGGHGMIAGGWMEPSRPDGDFEQLADQVARKLARSLKKNPDRLIALTS